MLRWTSSNKWEGSFTGLESLLCVTFGVGITITLSTAFSFSLASGAIVPDGGGSEVVGLSNGGVICI